MSKCDSGLLAMVKKVDDTAIDFSKATIGRVKRSRQLGLSQKRAKESSSNRYDNPDLEE